MNKAGKVSRVRVYRPDRSYTSPVEDVAAERFFYSDFSADGSETLDDAITRYENELASDLAELNAKPGPVSSSTAARVVTHLLIRSDHVRGLMRAGASAMAVHIEEIFGSADKISALLGAGTNVPGAQFERIFAENIADDPMVKATGLPPAAMMPIAHMALRESAAAGYGGMTDAIAGIVDRLQTEGPLQAKDTHASVLNSSLAPEKRVAILKALEWRVEDRADIRLILPDFVALGWDREGVAGSLLEHGKDDLAAVVMPLSPKRALIGQIAGGDQVDVGSFNDQAIPHCLSFFVASAEDAELEKAAALIGRDAGSGIRRSLENAAAGFRARISEPPAEPAPTSPAWAAEPLGAIGLQSDWLNQENAARLGQVVGQLLGVAYPRFDITSLRQIVANADYDAALSSIDRGRFAELEPAPVSSSNGLGLAYNVNIERDGVDGVAIVLRDSVAAALLSDDDLAFGWGASVFLGQLARIGALSLIGSVFADGFTAGEMPDAWLFRCSLGGWKEWLIASYAGLLDPDLNQDHCALFRERLEAATDTLATIRREYREHADVDRLLEEAGAVLATLFESACACASLYPEEGDAALENILSQRGLTNWFRLLKMDLPGIWEVGTAYPAQEAFLVLNQHIRRLSLLGGLFFWEDDGRSRVEVPYWSDIEWMMSRITEAGGSAPVGSDQD